MTVRALQIIPTLDRSGAEKQLTLLAAGLPRERFDVRVCVLTRTGPLAADLDAAGIPWTLIGKRWKADPLALWKLRRHIQEWKPDLVQTWLFAANSFGRAAALSAGVPRVVASERSVDPWKSGWQFGVDRWLARRTAAIVVNSTGVRDFYTRHGLPNEKFEVIPNGVELPPPSTRTRADLLKELGLPEGARIVGAVGRLWPQKRLKDLIWAADLLKVIRDDVHLLIIGDGPLRDRLERYRRQVRIEDRVHFLGHRADVADLLPHFDVLWLGSGYEGMPNVVMEAMAAGVPVVATDIPGTRDLVQTNVTGYLVPIGDRAGFAKYTRKLLDDDALRNAFGAAGQARMREEFSVAKMIERYAAFYERILASG
jgi:glycosyltransferase involved in cell wall biosynthesis